MSRMKIMDAPLVVRMPAGRVAELKEIARRLAVERGRWVRLSDVVREALDATFPPKAKGGEQATVA